MKALTTIVIAMALAPQAGAAADPHAHHQHQAFAAADAAHGESLHHLAGTWTDHRGNRFRLADLAGAPAIVVMFYGSCNTACPVLLHDASRLERLLPDEVRARTRVLLVSFDDANDTPDALAEYARTRRVDDERWRLVHGDRTQVRELAMLLGVRFRRNEDGSFNHTNLVTVLDGSGRIVHRVEGLMQPMEAAAAALTAVHD